MKLLDQIFVGSEKGVTRSVDLYVGDLSAIPASEAVDLLVVSAFPDDYIPTPSSLIGALHRKGVSVASLAQNKAVDLREFSSCWLSQPIDAAAANFRRLLCFEHQRRGTGPELVGDVFRSIVPFATGNEIRQIALPVLASGDQGGSPVVMLKSIVDAALHWMTIGLAVERIKIVLHSSYRLTELSEVFAAAKASFSASKTPVRKSQFTYDAFLSYSRQDATTAHSLINRLKSARPSLRLFVDTLELDTGAAWQQHIYEALDDCEKVIPLLSPPYIASKVCKEEYNIALFRHRESSEPVLVPILLQSTQLPTYMQLVQFIDAREGDSRKLDMAAQRTLSFVRG